MSEDAFVNEGNKGRPHGYHQELEVEANNIRRSFVRWHMSDVTAGFDGTLVSAYLELTVDSNGGGFGAGRDVNVHRMVQTDWSEVGMTWHCSHDTDPLDDLKDCSGAQAWSQASPTAAMWNLTPTDQINVTDATSGVLSFDVTADVAAAILASDVTISWMVGIDGDASGTGQIQFVSREALTDTPHLEVVGTVALPPAGSPPASSVTTLNALDDVHLIRTSSNLNYGTDDSIDVKGSPTNRTLLRFDETVIRSTVGVSADLVTATLRLPIDTAFVPANWGTGGAITVEPLNQGNWTEPAATWNCALDSNLANSNKDCSGATEWDMAGDEASWHFDLGPIDTFHMTNGATGNVDLDVTEEVVSIVDGSAHHGFLIRKAVENVNGEVEFESWDEGTGAQLLLDVVD